MKKVFGVPHSLDKSLLAITFILLGGGLLILGSASAALSQKDFGIISYYTLRQILTGVCTGLVAFFITSRIPYRTWKKWSIPLMILSFGLLTAVFLPQLGYSWGGARRWLDVGIFSFQPSEILKFSFIAYLAAWLDARRAQVGSVSYGMAPFALMIGIVGVFLIMQPDIGTLGIIVATAALLYLLGGGKISQMAVLFVLGAILFYLLVQIAPYRLNRILVFLDPNLDPQGIGYQINQAFIAIGSGGVFGKGFGQSIQKYNYLPEPIGDSIFAIFTEEVGFLGALVLILCFLFFFWRGMMIARCAPDMFGKLLAAGISTSIMVQAFVNMAAISGLLPLTGIALPFISYGGTSLAITLAEVGVLLNISKHT